MCLFASPGLEGIYSTGVIYGHQQPDRIGPSRRRDFICLAVNAAGRLTPENMTSGYHPAKIYHPIVKYDEGALYGRWNSSEGERPRNAFNIEHFYKGMTRDLSGT